MTGAAARDTVTADLDEATRREALAEIERFLAAMAAGLGAEEGGPARGRPRVLPALCLWAGLLVCVLRGARSQAALWRLLTVAGLWDYPRVALSDEAVYRRLAGGGTAPLERLFGQVRAVLAERLAPYAAADLAPFAAEVFALDAITLDRVARRLPALRAVARGDPRLLGGKLAGLFDLRRQLWHWVEQREDARENDKVAARDFLPHLPPGSLVLADLGYFSFAWFDDLTDADVSWVSRLRGKTSYTVLHTYYRRGDTFDGLVWLGAHRADRAKHAVRLVQFRVGPTLHRYITNVRDPRVLPAAEIARLYARRWDFELAANTAKTHLGLHLLWSAKPVVVQQQVWAVLIIAQVLQALRLEVAGRAGVDPFEVSLPLLIEYLPQFAARGLDPIAAFLAAGRHARFIRPSTRTRVRAPQIAPEELTHPPPDLALLRTPRYAQRKCDRHALTSL